MPPPNDDSLVHQLSSKFSFLRGVSDWSRPEWVWGNRNARAPLHEAAQLGLDVAVRFLVEKCGVDVDSLVVHTGNGKGEGDFRCTALHAAVRNKRASTVKLLLRLGADASVVGTFGERKGTPREFADGHVEIARMLVQYEEESMRSPKRGGRDVSSSKLEVERGRKQLEQSRQEEHNLEMGQLKSAFEEERSKLEQRNRDLDKLLSQADRRNQDLDKLLRDTVSEMDLRIQDLNRRNRDLAQSNQILEMLLGDARSEADRDKQALNRKNQDLAQSNHKLQTLEKLLGDTRSEADRDKQDLKRRNRELAQSNYDLQLFVNSLKNSNRALTMDLAKKLEPADVEKHFSDLYRANRELSRNNGKLTFRNQELARDVENWERRSADLKGKIKSLEDSNKCLKLKSVQPGAEPERSVLVDMKSCPICFDVARQVFSCCKCENWLCGDCRGDKRVVKCPSCRADFKRFPARRNKTAERILGL